ncbi:hypothetical protein SD70_06000 [Gordoniibacillus kamchatkensis]|uniref:UspA domain-containing protein n=1 Tax=Gordoniibacillus kamchatkensis TaxID=1590651 RepID=A0ABR5AMA1_9BACL|nr:universal stress protein [Paenibacillus sp. VKM B-2647]KIL41665.1 hypothetical protein SD70_06000 [Paenibacillus sp. VKM B-2647]
MFCSNILVAFDGSVASEKALDKAVSIAAMDPRIGIHVLHVVRPRTGAIYVTGDGSLFEYDMKHGQDVAGKAERRLSGLANPQTVSVVSGIPEDEIVKFAASNGCDMIVVGSRGLSGLKELILGSVSHFVAQNADIPVLIVK